MGISSSINILPVIPNENSLSVAVPTANDHDIAEFAHVAELHSKLRAIADVREEEIQRGKVLVESPAYPPGYMILRLARLMAAALG